MTGAKFRATSVAIKRVFHTFMYVSMYGQKICISCVLLYVLEKKIGMVVILSAQMVN